MIEVRQVWFQRFVTIFTAVGAIMALSATAQAKGAKPFPKESFKVCYETPVEQCAHDLAAHWKEDRTIADKPCHPNDWVPNSTEQYICHYLFGKGATEAGPAPVPTPLPAPAPSKCQKEKTDLEELLTKEQAAEAECQKSLETCPKGSKEADAELRSNLEDTKKALQACELEKAELKSELESNSVELTQVKKEKQECLKRPGLAPEEKPEAGTHAYGTSMRVGFAWILASHELSAPSLALSIAHRIWGTHHFDLNVDLDAVNFFFGSGGGTLVGGGAELDWYPHRTDNFAWGIGAQINYAIAVSESSQVRAYGNGAELQLQLMMQWAVAKQWALGFRLHAGGFGTAAVGWGGVFGIDLAVVHHAHED
jgi:hypothetical protein